MGTLREAVERLAGGRAAAEEGRRMRAVWNETTIAESDRTLVIEQNHYFPPDAVRREYLQASDRRTRCLWKGIASYHDVVVDGRRARAAAWVYEDPKPAAARLAGHVAFWNGVRVLPADDPPT